MDTQAVARVFRARVKRRGVVCQARLEEAKKLGERKRPIRGGHFFGHSLEMLKRVGNFGTFGVIEIHIGQEMNSRVELLHANGLPNWGDDIGGSAINQEEIEGVVAVRGLTLNGRGSLPGRHRLKGVQAEQAPRTSARVSRLQRVPV